MPPHPPTYFPDLLGPPHLLVASMLPDKTIKWAPSKAAQDAELVLLGGLAGSGIRHEASLGIFIEAVRQLQHIFWGGNHFLARFGAPYHPSRRPGDMFYLVHTS